MDPPSYKKFLKKWTTLTYMHLQAWRNNRDGLKLSTATVEDYYSYCREIAEVIASYSDMLLGGRDKKVKVDETFLTNRKYHRGRMTEQMTITFLGLYCKEDKIGLFLKVNAKSKKELCPYIKKLLHYETSRTCTDSAKQYQGVEKMFSSDTVHLQTNHSIGEYVDQFNPMKSSKLLHQYMALYFYRQVKLSEYKNDLGSQLMQFLLDINTVYPGIVNGVIQEGLTLKEIDPPCIFNISGNRVPSSTKKTEIR
ncbi:hypothetical protein TKK_0013326 [Trichogramma kaykai]